MPARFDVERDAVAGDWASVADDCITTYCGCSGEYAGLCGKEMRLEAYRPQLLATIRARIMGDPSHPNQNPVTGKGHSATSAEEAARIDPEYLAHLAYQSEVVILKNTAHGLAQAAWLRASLAIARFKAGAGLA